MLKYIRRDIRFGIVNRSFLFVIAMVFSFVMVLECSETMRVVKEMKYMWSNGTVMDYFIYSLKGASYYCFDPKDKFKIPLFWFIFQTGLSYFIAYYAVEDYANNGKLIILAGRSRTLWWISKMIWCVLSVLSYFFVAFISCILFALLRGADMSLNVTDSFFIAHFGYNMTFISHTDLIIIAVVIPIMISIGISLIQVLLSFIISPVTSFAVMCGLYIVSTYYTVWFLPGNFTMWLRSSYYVERGLNPLSGLIIAVFCMFATCVMGKNYFENKDII